MAIVTLSHLAYFPNRGEISGNFGMIYSYYLKTRLKNCASYLYHLKVHHNSLINRFDDKNMYQKALHEIYEVA